MKKESTKQMLFEMMQKVNPDFKGKLNEEIDNGVNYDEIYNSKILPNLDRIAMIINKTIRGGSSEIPEKSGMYKYGAYAIGESHTEDLLRLMNKMGQPKDNNNLIINNKFNFDFDYVDKLVDDLEKNKLIYLEW